MFIIIITVVRKLSVFTGNITMLYICSLFGKYHLNLCRPSLIILCETSIDTCRGHWNEKTFLFIDDVLLLCLVCSSFFADVRCGLLGDRTVTHDGYCSVVAYRIPEIDSSAAVTFVRVLRRRV